MLTKHHGYKVDARSTWYFEDETLGEQKGYRGIIKFDRRFTFTEAIREAIAQSNGNQPDTWVARNLFEMVSRRLKTSRIEGELYFFRAVGTPADSLYETDAFFCLDHEDGIFLVTIDAFYTPNETTIDIIEGYAESLNDFRFESLDNHMPSLMSMARHFLIGRYSDFQSVLYEFKKKLKKEWNEEAKKKSEVVDAEAPKKEEKEILRPSNHFILTPFDVERGRGLRALAREITDSLINQIRSKKPST